MISPCPCQRAAEAMREAALEAVRAEGAEGTVAIARHFRTLGAISALPLPACECGIVSEIAAERRRQVRVEGWSAAHDDQHAQGEIARAAAAYALHAGWQSHPRATGWPFFPPGFWPWDDAWWKPKDRRRNLVRAAALIIAEIERLDRAAPEHERGGKA